ncbi:MAG: hypothetical protein H8E20_02260 [Verrucomicrobia bacterium]|nr:hypothetical protein [Verrucomicrobiota bacterium]
MDGNPDRQPDGSEAALSAVALSPFKADAWQRLTPRERLRRSWAMRARLKDPQAAHDRKFLLQP